MKLSEIITEIQAVIQDDFWTTAKVAPVVNRGLNVVASGIILPDRYQLTPPLPDLYTTGTIETVVGSGVCPLPEDFNRDLIQVVNSGGEGISIVPSFKKFLAAHPDKPTGSVWTCSRHGKKLLYRDLPAEAETLDVHYYCNPPTLACNEDDDDEPTCIPDNLHYPLLVGYGCSQIFNLIEDGIEGKKVNTAMWNQVFIQGLLDLEIHIGFDAEPDYYDDLLERIS